MSVTVVIPAYNAAKHLPETLRSVLGQSLLPEEILVIDDGSTDGTAAIAAAFGPSVRVIQRENVRQAASRNFGVEQARTEWIAFVDADDLWAPKKLERQMAELQKDPDADVCYTSRIELLQDGDKVRLGNVSQAAPPDQIREALFHNTNFLPSSVVIRRSAFLAVGGFDTHFTIVEDWDLWLRLLHAGTKFVCCLEPLMQYRIHSNSMSHKAMVVLREKEEIYRRHILPHLPKLTRGFMHNKAQSEHESCAAYVLRDVGDPRCIPVMAKSILRSPLQEPLRYLALAHMLYKQARKRA